MEELADGMALADRYLLGPAVGHGAMGQVHLAEDLRLVRPVAVKSLRPELARYADVRERFGKEARAAARISHPNVVRVYDSGEHGTIPYLVMECLPGSTLADELAWGPLEPRRARRVGLDVLGALDAAHRLGIVHRDVKPGNILLSADLDGPVKVGDFGIAKSAADRSLTDTGSMIGTPAYLAPERVEGGAATPGTDLYSVGVVLYEALAGRKPYEGESSIATALAIHMGGAPQLLELLPDLDPALADIVERALARDPADRWTTAAEMADALAAWRPKAEPAGAGAGAAARAPVVAAPAVPTALLPDASASDPTLVASGRSSGATTVAAAPAPAPRPGPERRRRGLILGLGGLGLVLLVLVAGMRARRGEEPIETLTPPTSAEVVAAPTSTTTSTPTEDSVAPAPVIAPRTTRATVRQAAPTTPAPPLTTTAPTTTTTLPVTTTRPPPTTAPPTTAPPTTPPAATAP